jgi:hypothetical protein
MNQLLRSRKFIIKNILKKGGSILLLPFFIALFSCAQGDLANLGKLSFHNTGGKESFIFTVSDEFIADNKDSPADEYNAKISEAEAELLTKILSRNNYCDNKKTPSFVITSKQEKIFDMTFAHLIEENYNARAIVPRTYFGQCRSK